MSALKPKLCGSRLGAPERPLDNLARFVLEFERVQNISNTEGKTMESPYTLILLVLFTAYAIAFPIAVGCIGVKTKGSLPAIASTAIVVSALLGLWVPYLCAWGMMAIIFSTFALTVWLGVSLLPMPVPPGAVSGNTEFSNFSDKVRSMPAYVRLFMLSVYIGSAWTGYIILMYQYLPQVWFFYAANLMVSMYLCGSAIRFLSKQVRRSVS